MERVDGARLTMRVPVEQTALLLNALAESRITDLVWERPSLEDIFLAYYREDRDAP